jgi:hypothetical protein
MIISFRIGNGEFVLKIEPEYGYIETPDHLRYLLTSRSALEMAEAMRAVSVVLKEIELKEIESKKRLRL